jgi:hypothetical protein
VTNPVKKEREDITTADIAQRNRPERTASETEPGRPQLVQSERKAGQSASSAQGIAGGETQTTPLFPENELQDLKTKWDRIQTAFVDEPRKAVEQADSLVASAMKRLAEVFAQERSKLEGQWDRGDNVSTEDLRVALQRYRSFFHRLLAI